MILYIDFESRGVVELGGQKSVGVYNYIRHPQTQALMLSWVIDDGPVHVWQMHEGPMPKELRAALANPLIRIVAFNSTFERYMLEFKFGCTIPISRFEDPQASARYLSLPGDLADVSAILGLPKNKAKDKEGDRLIKLFCVPHKDKKKRGEAVTYSWCDWNTHPDDWKLFVEYCRQDTVAEREVLRREQLLEAWPLPPQERRIWEMDQAINDRGLPICRLFVTNALALATREKKEKIEINNGLTGLENSNSNDQMKEWAIGQGYDGRDAEDDRKISLEKDVVKSELKKNPNLTPLLREVLEIRQSASSTSYKKMAAILRQVSEDDRVRNQFQYMGSSRCGRWSGAGLQFHNMARPIEMFEDEDTVDEARDMIYNMDYDGIRERFLDPITKKPLGVLLTVKSNIRTAFVTKYPNRFDVTDLNSIETRMGAWLAGCAPLLEVFALGRDAYLDFASKMTNIPYDVLARDIKSKDPVIKAAAKRHRQIAKPGVLGCFGADTLVLTNRGWIRIADVHTADLLFDGVEWVHHEGVLDKGIKSVIDLRGVKVTPDHEILVAEGDWKCVKDVSQNTLFEKQAIRLASGLLSVANSIDNTTTFANVLGAESKNQFLNKILNSQRQAHVNHALFEKPKKKRMVFTSVSLRTPEKLLTGSQTDTMPYYPAAKGLVLPRIATLVGVSLVHLLPFTTLWSMFLPCRDLITRNSNSTEKTTTEIMSEETFGSLLRGLTIGIKRLTVTLNIRVKNIVRRIFGKNSHLDIGVSETSPEPFEKGLPQSGLSQDKVAAEVRTYDILNSGPRSRFMIATNKGPMIAHNCIYRMSATTLLEYAEAMGVIMTMTQAEEVVRVFREAYKEIVNAWFRLEEKIEEVMTGAEGTVRYFGPNNCIKIDKFTFGCNDNVRTILRLHLPSGRKIHYMDATWEDTLMPWTDKNGDLVYRKALNYAAQNQKTKQWTYTSTHGGKIFENIDQGMSRDVLAEKMLMFEDAGLFIVGHVHDEAITENEDDPFSPGLAEMDRIAALPVLWAPGLPLKSDGFSGTYYHK